MKTNEKYVIKNKYFSVFPSELKGRLKKASSKKDEDKIIIDFYKDHSFGDGAEVPFSRPIDPCKKKTNNDCNDCHVERKEQCIKYKDIWGIHSCVLI